MSEKPKLPEYIVSTPLTREEFVAKEKALANMKTMTMRRAIFNTLRPSHLMAEPEILRERAIALLIDRDKGTRVLWTYVLLDDQTFVRGPVYPETDQDWPASYLYMLELPRVQVT